MECGAAGKCAASESWAPARGLASVGRHKSEQSELPRVTQLSLPCCRADTETRGYECVHQVLNFRVGAVLLRMLLLSALESTEGKQDPSVLTGSLSPAGTETPKSYLSMRYNLEGVQLSRERPSNNQGRSLSNHVPTHGWYLKDPGLLFYPLVEALCHQTLVYCDPGAIYLFQHHHSAVHTNCSAAHEDTHSKQGQFMPTCADNSDSFLTLNPVLLCGCFQLYLLLSLSFLLSLPGGL